MIKKNNKKKIKIFFATFFATDEAYNDRNLFKE